MTGQPPLQPLSQGLLWSVEQAKCIESALMSMILIFSKAEHVSEINLTIIYTYIIGLKNDT